MDSKAERIVKVHPKEGVQGDGWEIDIVIIAGVRTIQPHDWKDTSGSWLEVLVASLAPRAQSWLFEYSISSTSPVLPQLFKKARMLLSCLADHIAATGRIKPRPLVFICHSLGGIILKRALCSARSGFDNSIIGLTINVISLSTPHIIRGSEPPSNILDLILRSNQTAPQKYEILNDDNQKILELSEDFEKALLPIPFLLAFEGLPTKIQEDRFIKFRKTRNPSQVIIVNETLASVKAKGERLVKVQATHNDICKLDVGGSLYRKIYEICKNAVENGPAIVARNENYVAPPALRADHIRDGTGNSASSTTPISLAVNIEGPEVPPEPPVDPPSSTPTPPPIPAEAPARRDVKLPCFSRQSIERNEDFFGRDDILRLIDEHLLPSSTINAALEGPKLSAFALCGMGGIGKTQVAIEYAFSRAKHFDAIFWLYADDRTILAQNLASIAVELGLEDPGEGAQNLTVSCRRVQEWLSNPVRTLTPADGDNSKASWLIIFDNVDDPKVLDDYWPVNGDGSVLVTSRDPRAKLHFRHSRNGVDLSPLTIEEGVSFMEHLTEAQPLAKDEKSLDRVADILGGLPLAIAQMAGIILDLRLSSYEEFLQFYDDAGAKQLYKMQGEDTKLGYNRTLATVWALDMLSPETLALFRVMSLLDPDRVPEIILTTGGAEVQVAGYPKHRLDYFKARAQLLKSSLIKVNEGRKELSVHRVVQDSARAEMDDSQFREIFKAALTLIIKVWPFQTLRNRHYVARKETCERLYPSVVRLKRAFDDASHSNSFQPDDEFAALLNDLGWYLLERGFVQESKTYYELAQKICENSENKDSENVALNLRMSHNNQTSAAAATNERRSCLDHSLIWLQMSIERKTPAGLPLEDYELGIVYNETGVAYGMNEMWDTAAEYFIKSMNVMKELENYDDTMLGWPEPNLGLIYWVQGKFDEAEVVLNEILEIHATAYGVDDTQSFKTGKILHALGNLSWSQCRLDESLGFHTRAFDQYMVTLGSGHHRTADVRHRLTMHYMRLGKLPEAETTINEALHVFNAGPYHKPEVARSTFKKSQLLGLKGDKDGAAKLEAEAVKLRRSLVPKDARPADELTEQDFDCLPIFWSR